MQNSRSSSISPFNSTALPPSLVDGLLNTPNSTAADYIARGVLWPYSQLFSTPYFSQPPPPTAAAYPIPIYCPTKPHLLDSNMHFQNNSSLLRPATTTNDPSNSGVGGNNNNMTIQIGLQCHNEAPSSCASPQAKKSAPVELPLEDQEPPQDEMNRKLYEFTKLAIHGCDLAEKVTKNHKYRPCFKKIDSLCARLKQDISRPDGVLNNLNSQGMAWAVKDFIFVFTRIINAWLILKGYIYNRSEGMRKVQAAFSGSFQEGFFQWQRVTQQLIENIIESFENLDEAVQKSRTNGVNVSSGGGGGAGASNKPTSAAAAAARMASIDLSNFLWENKEVTMRKSSNKGGDEDRASHYAEPQQPHVATAARAGTNLATPVYNEAERDEFETYYKTGLYQSMKRSGATGAALAREARVGERKEEAEDLLEAQKENVSPPQEMDLIDKLNLENNIKRYEEETASTIRYLLDRVRGIRETSYFFNVHFLKNYFPDFDKVITDLKDIRTIMVDAEQGKYKYVFALVADLRLIIQSCKLYLNFNPNAQRAHVVANFEQELEVILSEKCFTN